jgi:hypothetical protein
MPSIAREIVDAILDKDNVNANEKIYDALYGKSSEELLARKAVIAKHFFNPELKTQKNPKSNSNETNIRRNRRHSFYCRTKF